MQCRNAGTDPGAPRSPSRRTGRRSPRSKCRSPHRKSSRSDFGTSPERYLVDTKCPRTCSKHKPIAEKPQPRSVSKAVEKSSSFIGNCKPCQREGVKCIPYPTIEPTQTQTSRNQFPVCPKQMQIQVPSKIQMPPIQTQLPEGARSPCAPCTQALEQAFSPCPLATQVPTPRDVYSQSPERIVRPRDTYFQSPEQHRSPREGFAQTTPQPYCPAIRSYPSSPRQVRTPPPRISYPNYTPPMSQRHAEPEPHTWPASDYNYTPCDPCISSLKKANCNMPAGGNLKEMCDVYKQVALHCKDTVWTVKIMKDSANTAKIIETPAIVQTSMTTIINAKKLESLLPLNERFLDDEICGDVLLDPKMERFVKCTPCIQATKEMHHRPKHTVSKCSGTPSVPRSDSSTPTSSCFPCSKKSKKTKKKRKKRHRNSRPMPPDPITNCSENYIS